MKLVSTALNTVEERWREARRVRSNAKKFRVENKKFKAENPGVAVPPLSLAFDAYGHTSIPGYFRQGGEHAKLIADKIRAARSQGAAIPERPIILDWGCGPGKVLRRLRPELEPLRPVLVGSDYNPRTIRWCRNNLPGILFVENELAPPLSFPDRYFDVIYAISVFTHLSERLIEEWRDEMFRMLSPGGIFIVTLHGERISRHLGAGVEGDAFQRDELVVLHRGEEGKQDFQSFHPAAWVRDNFVGPFDCLEHDDRPHFDWFHQDIWVLKRP